MKLLSFVLSAALLVSAVGCKKSPPAEGPAEQAGKKVDNAAQEVKKGASDAADEVEETADEAKKKAK